jgi:hypothetical protein
MFADVYEMARLSKGKAISLCPLLLTMPNILKKSCPLYPESGNVQCDQGCPLSANNGHRGADARAIFLPNAM